jgi:WhiB family redox-sensing transcriptional regulator
MTDWRLSASCAETDPELFFPEQGGSSGKAKQVCLSCEVTADCLDFALTNGIRYGVWGGLSGHQRRRLERTRA